MAAGASAAPTRPTRTSYCRSEPISSQGGSCGKEARCETYLSEPRSTATFIARILFAKPDLTLDVLRRIAPRLDQIDDHALTQAIEFFATPTPEDQSIMNSSHLQYVRRLLPLTSYPYIGSRKNCPVCGSDDSSRVAGMDRRIKFMDTVRCHSCGLLRTDPLPDESELAEYYLDSYRKDYQAAFFGPKRRHRLKRLREARMRAGGIAKFLSPKARVIDAGCGSGEFVEIMLAKGFDALGFDPGASYAGAGSERLGSRIYVSDWTRESHEGTFDLVASFHVLEHLLDPAGAIAAFSQWSKPDGLIYLEVPDMAVSARKGFGQFHFAHVVGFNHFNLRLAAQRAGLTLLHAFSPTGLVFKKGVEGDARSLAKSGADLSQDLFSGNAYTQYARYVVERKILRLRDRYPAQSE